MNQDDLLRRVIGDIQRSPSKTVIYLEGKTDIEPFFALLGVATPVGDLNNGHLYQDVLVRGLGARDGSGSSAVIARTTLALKQGLPQVYGILDGDGTNLIDLEQVFDPPFKGPLFRWKSYCIENLLVKTGAPQYWQVEPNWQIELRRYSPYVAINRVIRELQETLERTSLHDFLKPDLSHPLLTVEAFRARLETAHSDLEQFGVVSRFERSLAGFTAALDRSTDEVHALLNGKWLINDMAPRLTGRDRDTCRFDLIVHATRSGGLPEVRAWWERITGSAP